MSVSKVVMSDGGFILIIVVSSYVNLGRIYKAQLWDKSCCLLGGLMHLTKGREKKIDAIFLVVMVGGPKPFCIIVQSFEHVTQCEVDPNKDKVSREQARSNIQKIVPVYKKFVTFFVIRVKVVACVVLIELFFAWRPKLLCQVLRYRIIRQDFQYYH